MLPDLWIDFVLAWFILFPAYAANSIPVLARGRKPLDFGKSWRGNRILGDGKTFEGTITGITAGFLVGALEFYLMPSFQEYASQFNVTLPDITLLVAFLIGLGAMAGDILGSFVKRRQGIPRGGKDLFLDRFGFIVFAILFVYLFVSLTPLMIIYMLIITFMLHRVSNFLAFKLRLKKVPW